MKTIVHLSTGLVLFLFISMHLFNASLGIVSIGAMDAASAYLIKPWTSTIGIGLLMTAALTYMSLALWTTVSRRSLNLPKWQWVQLVFGLAIPFLMVEHALGTAGIRIAFDMEPSYGFVLAAFWRFEPILGVIQGLLLLVAWTHASIGLHHWLRFKPWYANARPYLFAIAIALPTMALAGFISGGLEARALSADSAWVKQLLADVQYPGRQANAFVTNGAWVMRGIVASAIALVFIVFTVRLFVQQRRATCRVRYPSGDIIPGQAGATILEISRSANIPHASVCGGRGRCSTCRVRIVEGQTSLPPPSPAELSVLRRLNLPHNVRLACQTRPTGDVQIEPLLAPNTDLSAALRAQDKLHGEEIDIAVMFCDIRGFTTLSEERLPYDTVFLLNRYFATMGEAITESGGRVDKFIGDGIMALFGVGSDLETGCRDAIRAAKRMAEELDCMNDVFSNELPAPLRIGIGIQAGPAIVGEMGYKEATSVTAIGDTVNTASRLESVTKRENVQTIIGKSVADGAKLDLSTFPLRALQMRGRQESAEGYLILDAKTLPDVGPR